MKRWLALALCLAMVFSLAACGKDDGKPTADPNQTGNDPAVTDQPAAEQVYRQLYASEVTTFNYLYTGNTNDLQMSANTVDCLVEYDSYGVMIPSLAESWEANADNTEWTFHIRKGVKWVDYQGNEVADVTAHDWVTAAKYSNTAENEASNQYMYDGIVKNAQAYFNYTAYLLESDNGAKTVDEEGNEIKVVPEVKWEDVGVKATDDYTLVYTMEAPCAYFPSVLSYSSYMPVYEPFLTEQGKNFGAATGPDTILYNGAFLMSEFAPQDHRTLVKNPTYWDKDNVFIDRLELRYNSTAGTIGPEQFIRGEVDYAELDASLLTSWLTDDNTYNMVSSSRPNVSYSYFYVFNFEPRFDASLDPDNWTLAVNNENFRQSIMHALDRVGALAVQDPQNPESIVNNTVTPPTFVSGAGMDFTEYPALKAITDGDSFDADLALEYKAKAVEELTAAGCKFPVKVYMRYNPDTTNWDKECQVVEQQLENALGKDYIDVIVEAGPSTGFLGAVRRTGDFGLMKCNWGADYADPQTWTDPFSKTNTYNFMNQDASRSVGDVACDHKGAETQAIVEEYYRLVDAAKAITTDEAARYTAFAEAEAHLINHAIIVPYSISFTGYVATRLNAFEGEYAPYGLALQRYKYQHLLEEPMNMAKFTAENDKWQTERAAALEANK
ncbi:MAG: peptide ABC transporter substrate-binding protein [Oscillospiraceae bacterium]